MRQNDNLLLDKNGIEIKPGDIVVQFKKGIKPLNEQIKPGEIWGYDPSVGIPDKTFKEKVTFSKRWGTHPFNGEVCEYDPNPRKWEILK